MSDKMIENNQVTVMGEIVTPFSFSHEVFGEGFYMVEVDVKRLSNSKDRIPLMIVFVREITFVEEELDGAKTNQIFLDGYICKQPVYRKTPLGREIADLLLAVNRPYGKSDYIPCICWGRNARFAGKFEVGTHIHLWGRIQSRTYQKRLEDDVVEKRTAYEISVNKIECVE